MRRTVSSFSLLLLLASFASLGAPRAASGISAAGADPFYLGLLRDGRAAWSRGDHATARRDLRIACFGLLDEPTVLGECLTLLGLAQSAANDEVGLRETYSRLLEIEQRFHGYSDAQIPDDERQAFEQVLAARIAPEALRASPTFARLIDAREEQQLRALPARERIGALESRIEADPRSLRWRRMAAEAAAELERWDAVVTHASAVLVQQPEVALKCLRGRAQAQLGQWQAAVADLAVCDSTTTEPTSAEALLRARLELGQTAEAQRLVESLDEPIRKDASIGRLVRQLEKKVEAEQRAATAAAAAAAPAPDLDAPAEVAQSRPATPTADDLRDQLRSARSREDLEPVLLQAERLAEANPRSQEIQHLTAEIAYRAGRWRESVEYFRRGGDPGDERPSQLFYYAVALYESGETEQAAVTLRRCLPNLKRTQFVESYVERILGGSG